MIVAMPRFRVLAGRDPDDCTIFHLVTRWSGPASFRTWHSGPAHMRSHESLPKGRKLASAHIALRIPERLEAGQAGDIFEHCAGDRGALTRAPLASGAMAHGVIATPRGGILTATPAAERLLGSEPGRLQGQSPGQFPIPESAAGCAAARRRKAAAGVPASACSLVT
jgi:hypothetical protein